MMRCPWQRQHCVLRTNQPWVDWLQAQCFIWCGHRYLSGVNHKCSQTIPLRSAMWWDEVCEEMLKAYVIITGPLWEQRWKIRLLQSKVPHKNCHTQEWLARSSQTHSENSKCLSQYKSIAHIEKILTCVFDALGLNFIPNKNSPQIKI